MTRFASSRTSFAAVLLSLGALSQTAAAQDAPNGKSAVGAATLVRLQARVVSIEPETNSVVLRGPRGNLADIEVNRDVADVSKLHVGDRVNIEYTNAILISADKVDAKGVRERVETSVAQPASGGVAAAARRVEVIATVQKIDRKHRMITLRGPRQTAVFDVVPDVSLDGLKVGDSVRAVFLSAAAASLARDGTEVK